MIGVSFFRAIKFSLQDIVRNFWLSIVTVTILSLALFSVNLLITVQLISQSGINTVKEKIDLVLYLKPGSDEKEILSLKALISNLDNVQSVEYTTTASALENFKQSFKDKPIILEALRELNKNPLPPSLVIKPVNFETYEDLTQELKKIENEIIESRDFSKSKDLLDKVNLIAERVQEVGLVISLIFIIITILVVYNTIRVAVYTHQREIGIMRLVGASNWFIRVPYLISSIVYTFLGVAVIVAVYYSFLGLLNPYLVVFFSDFNLNLINYFNKNFVAIFGLQFVVAALINIVASLIAVGKYSKV